MKTPSITQTSDGLCLRISKMPRFIISLALKVVMSMIHIKYSVKWCDINPSIHHYPIFSSFEMGGKSFSNLCHGWVRHECHDRPHCSWATTTRRSVQRLENKWLNWRRNSVSWGTKCWMDMPTEAMLTFYGGQYKCIVSMYAMLLIIHIYGNYTYLCHFMSCLQYSCYVQIKSSIQTYPDVMGGLKSLPKPSIHFYQNSSDLGRQSS